MPSFARRLLRPFAPWHGQMSWGMGHESVMRSFRPHNGPIQQCGARRVRRFEHALAVLAGHDGCSQEKMQHGTTLDVCQCQVMPSQLRCAAVATA